ncbi:MAG: hypothetical protein QM751_02735 [Paludibacteraceae bacterium]
MEKFDKKTLISRLIAENVVWDSAYNWHASNYVKRDFNGMRETLKKGDTIHLKIPVQPEELFITAKEAPQMSLIELRNYLHKQKKRGIGSIQAFEDEILQTIFNATCRNYYDIDWRYAFIKKSTRRNGIKSRYWFSA